MAGPPGSPAAPAAAAAPAAPPIPDSPPSQPSRGGGRVALLVVMGVLVAVAAGGGAYALTQGRDEPSPTPSTASDPEAIVREAVTAVQTVTTVAPPTVSAFIAQLASFRRQPNAEREAARLRASGVAAQALRSDDYEELLGGYWVVYAGPFQSRAAAQAAAESSGVKGAFGRPITPAR